MSKEQARAQVERPFYYLGPQGTFTHEAAIQAVSLLTTTSAVSYRLVEVADAVDIVKKVESGSGLGILAWESNVEGPVVPNMDALIDAELTVGFAMVRLNIVFDAFVMKNHERLTEVTAHSHGLAQCHSYANKLKLRTIAASSNAAACRDITSSQVALGPSICGRLYGLQTYASGVQDFQGAHTDFLVLGQRSEARLLSKSFEESINNVRNVTFETTLALIPLKTGPGVLADVLDQVRDAGLNMTSFMSRPIKGQDGTYCFIACVDGAPWQPTLRELMANLIGHNVWIKALAVCQRPVRSNPPVSQWMLPKGGVGKLDNNDQSESSVEKELLW